jgi:hypothetical protein
MAEFFDQLHRQGRRVGFRTVGHDREDARARSEDLAPIALMQPACAHARNRQGEIAASARDRIHERLSEPQHLAIADSDDLGAVVDREQPAHLADEFAAADVRRPWRSYRTSDAEPACDYKV